MSRRNGKEKCIRYGQLAHLGERFQTLGETFSDYFSIYCSILYSSTPITSVHIYQRFNDID